MQSQMLHKAESFWTSSSYEVYLIIHDFMLFPWDRAQGSLLRQVI